MPKGIPGPFTYCTIEGCTNLHTARGWCDMHYRRWQRFGDPQAVVGERLPWPARLLTRMSPQPSGCIHYTGLLRADGYGRLTGPDSRQHPVHRLAYELLVGPIPAGLTLDHLCHNQDEGCSGGSSCLHRRCINVDHLEPVTIGQNTRRGGNARKTHCKRGHEFTDENTYVTPGGQRQCRACIPIRPSLAH